jgi:hypothetical protein
LPLLRLMSFSGVSLVTVLQFSEPLSDRQAADAVRARIDWKDALGLELTDPGFHFSVLAEFRAPRRRRCQALAPGPDVGALQGPRSRQGARQTAH